MAAGRVKKGCTVRKWTMRNWLVLEHRAGVNKYVDNCTLRLDGSVISCIGGTYTVSDIRHTLYDQQFNIYQPLHVY